MPQKEFTWLPPDSILSYEEIINICNVLAALGVKKVRLTGGEPLVRRGLVGLVERLTEIDGLEDVCLTTNGVLLNGYADSLYQAGIKHINISLDSLSPKGFARITGRDLFDQVWQGIEKAMDKGFSPIKINSVIMKGINDNEVTDLAELSVKYPIQVRFIEFMPVGSGTFWSPDKIIICDEIRSRIEGTFGKLRSLRSSHNSGPATEYALDGAAGSLGFISPVSHHFCSECNRLRLSAEGRLRLCLFSDKEIDVKRALRQGLSSEELAVFFRQAVLKKPKGYKSPGRDWPSCIRNMYAIGG